MQSLAMPNTQPFLSNPPMPSANFTHPIFLYTPPFTAPFSQPYAPQPFTYPSIAKSSQEPRWYPNLGTNHHVTSDPKNLTTSKNYAGLDKLMLENGKSIDVSSSCFNYFSSQFGLARSMSLNNILHVLDIAKNLLSVSQFA